MGIATSQMKKLRFFEIADDAARLNTHIVNIFVSIVVNIFVSIVVDNITLIIGGQTKDFRERPNQAYSKFYHNYSLQSRFELAYLAFASTQGGEW